MTPMIYHSIRFALKDGVTEEQIAPAIAQLHKMGKEIEAVKFYCVGRDFGGEFEYGAMFALETIADYQDYMLHPIHRVVDDLGLPLVGKMISQDLTDDPDPEIGTKIAQIHKSRYESDPELLDMIQALPSYSGSGVP
jgi:hypothetical protein